MTPPRILVAGIGNIFLGDDAFGVEVAHRLHQLPLPPEVRVVDFGIRGLDLAYALLDDYDQVILVDTVQRGGNPGTLYVIEPDLTEPAAASPPQVLVEAHGMTPARVLQMVQALGGRCPPLRLVGCEPATFGTDEEPVMGLSEPVQAAVGEAVRLIGELTEATLAGVHL